MVGKAGVAQAVVLVLFKWFGNSTGSNLLQNQVLFQEASSILGRMHGIVCEYVVHSSFFLGSTCSARWSLLRACTCSLAEMQELWEWTQSYLGSGLLPSRQL